MAEPMDSIPRSSSATGCFACDRDHPSGLHLSFVVDVAARTARAQTVLDGCFAGADGIAHGGIVATLLDEAMVYASRAVVPLAATAKLSVRYRRPTPVRAPLVIMAEVLWVKHNAVRCRAYVRADGRILAQAEGTLLIAQE
ncbi:MAG: PaaI family thioesterase [Victivallales bacterium]|nr:PaaI family thioesterase [Victivallales bacterium]